MSDVMIAVDDDDRIHTQNHFGRGGSFIFIFISTSTILSLFSNHRTSSDDK